MKINRKIGVCTILFGISMGIALTSNAAPLNCQELYSQCLYLDSKGLDSGSCWAKFRSFCM